MEIVWAHGGNAEQMATLSTLRARMEEDGDAPQLIHTDSAERLDARGASGHDLPRIAGALPNLLLWFDMDLSDPLLARAQEMGIPSVLLDLGAGGQLPRGGWRPGRARRRLQAFDHIIAVNAPAAKRAIRAGAHEDKVHALGHFRDIPLPSAGSDQTAHQLAEGLGPRPVWLAASLPFDELPQVLGAHLRACRHAPRLLLAIDLADPAQRDAAVAACAQAHLSVQTAPNDIDPLDQVVLTAPGSMLDWARVAPATYLGGSISAGARSDPLSLAQLGSVVVHGRAMGRRVAQLKLLSDADASRPIGPRESLAEAIEDALAPHRAAQIAAAAWQVVTEGANASNFIIDVIRGEA